MKDFDRRLFETNAPFWPNRHWRRELFRPWKLLSFAIGMAWLLYGATHYEIGDWDVGISLIMGVLTYLFAPWTVFTIANALRYRRPRWPLRIVGALVPALFTVDTVYVLYHTLAGNPIYREANFPASASLYFLCGAIWWYRGSLSDPLRDAAAWRARQPFSRAREAGDAITSQAQAPSPADLPRGNPGLSLPTDVQIQGALVAAISDGFNRSMNALEEAGAIDRRKMSSEYRGVGSKYYDLVTDQILLTATYCTPMIREILERAPVEQSEGHDAESS